MFNINIPRESDQPLQLQLQPGEVLYVLGANGSGKSGLLANMASQAPAWRCTKISAHRQNVLQSDLNQLTAYSSKQQEAQIWNEQRTPQSRHKDQHGQLLFPIAISKLIRKDNAIKRQYWDAVEKEDTEKQERIRLASPPIKEINRILRESNLPIKLNISGEDERIQASKEGCPPYGADALSDV